MSDEGLTPEQRRHVRNARAALSDSQIQRRLNASAALAANPAFVRATAGFVDAVAGPLRHWNDVISGWVEQLDFDRIRAVIDKVGEAFLRLVPPNARALGVESWPTLQQLGSQEQLCLSWVPEEQLVRALLGAASREERDRLLAGSTNQVLASCDAALSEVVQTLSEVQINEQVWPPELAQVTGLMSACIRAAEDGHWAAAQALATCASDSLLTQYIANGDKPHTFLKLKLKQTEDRQFAALLVGPVLAALESSMKQPSTWKRADAPVGYSRNATVHAMSDRVFSEVNALKAIMIATSLLKVSVSPLLFFLIDLIPVTAVSVENDTSPS